MLTGGNHSSLRQYYYVSKIARFEITTYIHVNNANSMGWLIKPIQNSELLSIMLYKLLPVVSAAIDGTTGFDWSEHFASLHAASVSRRESVNSWYEERLHLILDQFPEAPQRTIKQAVGSGISHWLTTFPLEYYHFDLAPIEFRDALALRPVFADTTKSSQLV